MTGSKVASGFHKSAVNFIQWSPDSDVFATASDDYTIKIWNSDGELVQTLSGAHDQPVYALAFFKGGEDLISGGLDKRIIHWDLTTGKPHKGLKFRPHNFSVETIAFSPDYTRLVTGSRDLSWKLWEYQPTLVREIYKVPNAHFSYVMSSAWSPNGEKVITGSFDREIRQWNIVNGERIRVFEAAVKDDKKKKKSSGSHEKSIARVTWSSRDGIASIDTGGTAKVWSPDGTEIRAFDAHTGGNHIEYSHDSSKLTTTGEDGYVHVWSSTDFTKIATFSTNKVNIKCAAFNGSDKMIAYGDDIGSVFIADI